MADAAAPLPLPSFTIVGDRARRSGIPVFHGPAADLGSIIDNWLAARADGIACVIGTGDTKEVTLRATSRVRSLTPNVAKGLEFDLVVPLGLVAISNGIEGSADRHVAMTRATQRLVILPNA